MIEGVKRVLEGAAEHLGVGSSDDPPVPKYPHNVLEGFGNGCLLDLRVRIAVDLLKGPLYANVVAEGVDLGTEDNARDIAVHALDVSTALLAVAEARGLVEALPDDTGLNRQVQLQAERTARYGVMQQSAAGKVAQEEAGRVQPAGVMGRTFNQ